MQINNRSTRTIFWRVHPREDPSGVGLKEGLLLTGQGTSFENPRWTEYAIDLRRDWAMGDPIPGWNGTVSWNCTNTSIIDVNSATVVVAEPSPQTVSSPPGTQLGIGVLNMTYNDLHVALDWLGVLQEAKNNIRPRETAWFSASAAGSHNVTMIPAWAANSEMTPARWDEWNKNSIATLTVGALGTLLAAGSVVVSFGMTAPALAQTAAVLSQTLAAGSVIQTVAGFLIDGANDTPIAHQIRAVPGYDRGTFIVVTGGKLFGETREGKFVVEAISSLTSTTYAKPNPTSSEWYEVVKCGIDMHSKNYQWRFHQGKDIPDHDVGQFGKGLQPTAMKASASKLSNVVAFNTNGWFKDVVTPESSWRTWTTKPNEGLWVRTGTPQA